MGFYRGPNIVTDGLVYAMDAGSGRSYDGTTTLNDLVGSGTGTLTNGVTYQSINGGVFDFDGADDYIDFNSFLVPGISQYDTITNFTISVWINWDHFPTGNYDEIISWWRPGTDPYSDAFLGTTTSSAQGGSAANPGIRFGDGWTTTGANFTAATDVGKWWQITAVKTSNNAYVYFNDVLKATKGSALSWGFNYPPTIGRHPNGGEYFDGKIANMKLYNTALSAAEVTQNFNAQKTRFGL